MSAILLNVASVVHALSSMHPTAHGGSALAHVDPATVTIPQATACHIVHRELYASNRIKIKATTDVTESSSVTNIYIMGDRTETIALDIPGRACLAHADDDSQIAAGLSFLDHPCHSDYLLWVCDLARRDTAYRIVSRSRGRHGKGPQPKPLMLQCLAGHGTVALLYLDENANIVYLSTIDAVSLDTVSLVALNWTSHEPVPVYAGAIVSTTFGESTLAFLTTQYQKCAGAYASSGSREQVPADYVHVAYVYDFCGQLIDRLEMRTDARISTRRTDDLLVVRLSNETASDRYVVQYGYRPSASGATPILHEIGRVPCCRSVELGIASELKWASPLPGMELFCLCVNK